MGHLKRNLLGLPAIKALNLAVRIESMTNTTTSSVVDKFPSVFQGLGSLGKKYLIKLKDEATPVAIFTPRHISMPLCQGKTRV